MSTNWNQETKARLSDKVSANMNDIASLTRHMLRGSKSAELLEKAAKNFTYQENAIENSLTTLKKMGLLSSHLQFQAEAIERRIVSTEQVRQLIAYALCPFSTEEFLWQSPHGITHRYRMAAS